MNVAPCLWIAVTQMPLRYQSSAMQMHKLLLWSHSSALHCVWVDTLHVSQAPGDYLWTASHRQYSVLVFLPELLLHLQRVLVGVVAHLIPL